MNQPKIANLSLIIPTYNRPDYLRRILGYYSDFGEDYKIIVADSSSDENKEQNGKVIKRFPNLDILYLNEYPTTIMANLKIYQALEHIKTKYCVICGDDDFVTPHGIYQSLDFLEKNPDFAIAYGRYIGFKLKSGKGKKLTFRWNFSYSPRSIEFSNAEARLEYHLSSYLTATFYAVHRTDLMKMIFREALCFTDDHNFCELLLTMLTLTYGKAKSLDVLYGARDANPGRSSHAPNLADFIKAGAFDEKYARFRTCLSTHLSRNSRLDIEEAGELVDKAMSNYLHIHLLKTVVPIPKSKKRTILDSLPLPDWTKRGIVALYAATHKAFVIKPVALCNTLFAKPAFLLSKHRDDFNKIRLHLLSYSE